MNIRLVTAVAALLAPALSAKAQSGPTLVKDPVSGAYTISYTDDAGARRSVRFLGRDEVEPYVILSIDAGNSLRYSYTIGNGANAKLPLFAIDVPCEEQSGSPSPRPRMRVWNSVRAQLPGPLVFYCGWGLFNKGAMHGVPPDGRFGSTLLLQSAWLPGIRQGRARGHTDEVYFPGFRDETPELIDALFQPTQDPRVFSIVSPKYPPPAFENPVAGVSIVQEELSQACSLGWIGKERDEGERRSEARREQDGELCNELKEKLDQAQKQLARGKKKNGAHALQELLHELSEKKGERLNSNAYALLFTDVNYLVTKVLGIVPEKDD